MQFQNSNLNVFNSYAGSHNFTMAAWGQARKSEIIVRNYECGVVLVCYYYYFIVYFMVLTFLRFQKQKQKTIKESSTLLFE